MSEWKKYERDGEVAVLISPGYGGGWSTWNDEEYRDQLLFDSRIVEAVLNNDLDEAEKIAKSISPEVYIFTSGVCDLNVVWIPKDVLFRVEEYDGSESCVIGTSDYISA